MLKIDGVTKRYGKVLAVDEVNLDVGEGVEIALVAKSTGLSKSEVEKLNNEINNI